MSVQLSLGQGPILTLSKHEAWRLYDMDATAFLAAIPDEGANLIVTDPPYESLEKHRAVGTTTRLKKSKASSNEWFGVFQNERFPEFFREAYRALRRDSHLYVFTDVESQFVVKPAAEAAGFKFWNALVWDKVEIGMGYHYRRRHELILFFEKGKRRIANLSTPDVLAFKRVKGGYPTEKPVPLLEVLVSQSSVPGELVVDPFAGSGSTGVAALGIERRFLGNDISPDARAWASAELGRIAPGGLWK